MPDIPDSEALLAKESASIAPGTFKAKAPSAHHTLQHVSGSKVAIANTRHGVTAEVVGGDVDAQGRIPGDDAEREVRQFNLVDPLGILPQHVVPDTFTKNVILYVDML